MDLEAQAEVEATPDELLLELMDLVTLAFPEALTSFTVTFVENEDGRRPALTNLDGKPLGGAAAITRPPLGHDDNRVLDAINALLADFADATERGGGVRVHAGAIAARDDADGGDGARVVELRDVAGALVMTRRFDASELRWLFYTPALFRALATTSADEDEQAQAMKHELRRVTGFSIDMQRGDIAFTHEDGAPLFTFAFVLVGSWSDDTKRFLWGWANDQAPPSLVKAVDAVRLAATDDGLRAFTEPSFGCPDACAERLARHACVRMNGTGLYRAPFRSSQGKGVMYLALTTMK